MTAKRTDKMQKAFRIGIAAFENGMKCAPAHDDSLMDLIYANESRDLKIGSPESRENNACFKAWTQGWTMANIGAGGAE